MTHEYIEPSPRARRRALIALASGLVLGVTFEMVAVPAIRALPPCAALPWWSALLLLSAVVPIGVAIWQLFAIQNALRSRQQPPPRAEVAFRTRVRRGGHLYFALAVQLLAALGLICLVVYFAPLVLSMLAQARVQCAA